MIIIEISGTVLFSKLLRSDTMDLENNMVKYSRDELLEIRKIGKQDFTLRQINVKTLKEIRRYKINRRRKRAGNKIRLRQHQLGVNKCNLKTYMVKLLDDAEMRIKKSGSKIVTLSARSVKNKGRYIMECIRNFGWDMAVITETRLTDNDEILIDASELTKNGYKILTKNRIGRKGGGIALYLQIDFKCRVDCATT